MVSKARRARETIARSLEDLHQQLAEGNSARLDAFLRTMGRFHSYSVGNLLLILAQRPGATRVAGFHAWRSLGRAVKRGEKGIAILAPMRLKPQREDDEDDRERAPRLRFRVVHVFDVAQTEGKPLPELDRVRGDPGAALKRLERAVRAGGVAIETRDDLGGADGLSTGGRVVLRAGLSDAERFSVLAHEWAHELLHRGGGERPDSTVRETEAEAVAFVVGRRAGLETRRASSDYIRLHRGSAETLAASLERIQRAAAAIIDAMESDGPAAPRPSSVDAPARSIRERSR